MARVRMPCSCLLVGFRDEAAYSSAKLSQLDRRGSVSWLLRLGFVESTRVGWTLIGFDHGKQHRTGIIDWLGA